jgi:hypothetical protein
MHRRTIVSIAGMAMCTLLLGWAPGARAEEHDDMAMMIDNAKTAADHEKLAKHYDMEAADAKKQAELHRKMEKSYSVGPVAGKGTPTPLPQHCAALAKHYEEAAKEYAALAAAHRQMAKETK